MSRITMALYLSWWTCLIDYGISILHWLLHPFFFLTFPHLVYKNKSLVAESWVRCLNNWGLKIMGRWHRDKYSWIFFVSSQMVRKKIQNVMPVNRIWKFTEVRAITYPNFHKRREETYNWKGVIFQSLTEILYVSILAESRKAPHSFLAQQSPCKTKKTFQIC